MSTKNTAKAQPVSEAQEKPPLRKFYFPAKGVTIEAESLEAATEKFNQTFNQ